MYCTYYSPVSLLGAHPTDRLVCASGLPKLVSVGDALPELADCFSCATADMIVLQTVLSNYIATA